MSCNESELDSLSKHYYKNWKYDFRGSVNGHSLCSDFAGIRIPDYSEAGFTQTQAFRLVINGTVNCSQILGDNRYVELANPCDYLSNSSQIDLANDVLIASNGSWLSCNYQELQDYANSVKEPVLRAQYQSVFPKLYNSAVIEEPSAEDTLLVSMVKGVSFGDATSAVIISSSMLLIVFVLIFGVRKIFGFLSFR